jgi:hypothetical protein
MTTRKTWGIKDHIAYTGDKLILHLRERKGWEICKDLTSLPKVPGKDDDNNAVK